MRSTFIARFFNSCFGNIILCSCLQLALFSYLHFVFIWFAPPAFAFLLFFFFSSFHLFVASRFGVNKRLNNRWGLLLLPRWPLDRSKNVKRNISCDFSVKMKLFGMDNVCVHTVGRAVASNTRDPWFKSNHRQMLSTINCIEKTKIKKKRARMSHLKKLFIRQI